MRKLLPVNDKRRAIVISNTGQYPVVIRFGATKELEVLIPGLSTWSCGDMFLPGEMQRAVYCLSNKAILLVNEITS